MVLLPSCGESLDEGSSDTIALEETLPNTTGLVVMGVVSALAGSQEEQSHLRDLREECGRHMASIVSSELSYVRTHGDFVYSSEYVPDDRPGIEPREWPEGSGFDTLGWRPTDVVRGSYRVIRRTPNDFMISCITDVDGDGVHASWTATRYLNVVRTTPEDIY